MPPKLLKEIVEQISTPLGKLFAKAKPYLTNMLCFLEEITKWVHDGTPVDVVYLDFQNISMSAISKIVT